MADPLAKRFEQYFRHPDDDHDVMRIGDRAIASVNVRRALEMLDVPVRSVSADEYAFDEPLRDGVRIFQHKYQHRVADGVVGPGTRARLVAELLHRFSPDIFARLQRPEGWSRPSVFVSYASADHERVNKIDQWLRDHAVQVVRDCQFFVAGTTIEDNIVRALAHSDKILIVFSQHSRERDWPRFERELAERVEARLGAPVLIYLCLDGVPLPAHDSTRLAIRSNGKTLKQIGEEILHAVAGRPLPQYEYPYDENQPI